MVSVQWLAAARWVYICFALAGVVISMWAAIDADRTQRGMRIVRGNGKLRELIIGNRRNATAMAFLHLGFLWLGFNSLGIGPPPSGSVPIGPFGVGVKVPRLALAELYALAYTIMQGGVALAQLRTLLGRMALRR